MARIAKGAGKQLAPVRKALAPVGKHILPVAKAAILPLVQLSRLLALPAAARSAGHLNNWLAQRWTTERNLLKRLGVGSYEEVRQLPLEVLDGEARSVRTWAIAYGGAVGGVGGTLGLVAGLASTAAVIHLATRTIRQVGLCYGYDARDELESQFVVHVLSLATASSHAEKVTGAATLANIQQALLKKTWKAMAAANKGQVVEFGLTSLREGLKRVGIRLTKSRALVAVPVVGGGVGLLLDGNFLANVGEAAMRCYQERWLRDRGRFSIEFS